ncbi:MAG: hypothetical protein KJ900_12100 [Proteobacteria bacterium]|nr:hypothetical protein [Desulfocapsa sp.]MBU3943299.1 hypothetical protein [Pseudomonadota bacterium]MCG2744425.1 hypothetical protein [Desulfobacteraceae bacterium]MBU3984772.1 hypothetical protein [Pseudomonadota bacterium]MBU4028456.1 hypothetical protein [Pseudomonadota bacterium]
MDIKEYARTSKIPLKTLRWIAKKEIISDPLTDNELIGLELLENIWGKREVIRPQIRQLSLKNRKALIDTCDLDTKWERYAYSRFMNLESDKRLFMKTLILEIELTFRFKLSIFEIKKLYRIRKRVHRAKERQAQNLQHEIMEKSNNDPGKSEIVATK